MKNIENDYDNVRYINFIWGEAGNIFFQFDLQLVKPWKNQFALKYLTESYWLSSASPK